MSGDVSDTVEKRVRGVLEPVLDTPPGESGPAADTDLWSAGLNSLRSVTLMVGLEDEFGVEFPDEMLDRVTFATVTRITEAVRGLLGGAE